MKKWIVPWTILLLAGCTVSPVLYPNTHLSNVGNDQAQRDIALCREQADLYVKSDAAKEAAKETAVGGIGGAVIGGAMGAVDGSFGRGVGIGAAGGAAAGLVSGIIKASQPDPLYINFVNRCLNEKGYDIIGWQ
ncbi:MAG TPA: cell envelope biogenesis protein OmpA [Smithellaceae bacterium]|nr:cell envelope biogenesis protein OmpA [Smithellaceae bacterium]